MVTYRVHQKQLSETLQAQFIYENFPVFAGTDDFSLLIRLKYTGDITKSGFNIQLNDPFTSAKGINDTSTTVDSDNIKIHTATKSKANFDNNENVNSHNEQHSENNNNSSWFGSRLSSQFSNATRSLFLNSLNSVEEDETVGEKSRLNQKPDQKAETLFLGYGQILGHYLINDTIIDYSIFKDLQKSTIIEGKYAGIQGLTAHSDNSEDTLLSGLNVLYNTEINSLSTMNINDHMQFIPFYSSNQNIIFSELLFDPESWTSESQSIESVKSFYINCRLPKHLPPTYATEAVQINYNFIFGYQLMDGNNIISKTVFVPLKIEPFIDNYGRQPVFHLEKSYLNTYLEDLIIQDVSNHSSLIKHNSIIANEKSDQSRRISFWNLKKKIKPQSGQSNSLLSLEESNKSENVFGMSSLSNCLSFDGETINFLEILDSLDDTDVSGIIEVQKQFERRMNAMKAYKFNVRENLMQILADYKYVQSQKMHTTDFDDSLDYDYLLPKEQQIKYIIKQNHGIISTLLLNKGVFKLGDSINISISFEGSKYKTTGIELQLLKHQVFYREEYLKKGNYDEVSGRLDNNILETILYEQVLSAFNTSLINTDILIPTETEPQFKTNFFQSKYYIQVRFITIDNNGLDNPKTTDTNEADVNTESEPTSQEPGKEMSFEMTNIFTDITGSKLFCAKQHLLNANEFYIRIPIVILPTYEQDFGLLTAKV
jgi:hypothetical protein